MGTQALICDMLRTLSGKCFRATALSQLPQLEFYAGCFRFVQVTERVSEAAHSIVKRRSPPTAAAPLISLTLRLQDVARLLKIDSKALLGIGVHFERARHMQAAPGLVCLILISVMDPGSGGL